MKIFTVVYGGTFHVVRAETPEQAVLLIDNDPVSKEVILQRIKEVPIDGPPEIVSEYS